MKRLRIVKIGNSTLILFTFLVIGSCCHGPEIILPSWVKYPPRDCAVGMSGPTLNPGDAVRYAQEDARHNLAASTLGVKIQSVWLDNSDGYPVGATVQETHGLLRNTVIQSMWALSANNAPSSLKREVYALACNGNNGSLETQSGNVPDWVLNLSEKPGQTCALGLVGPTFHPEDQEERVKEDGASVLASRLETRVHSRIEDDGRTVATFYRKSKVPEGLVERLLPKVKIERQWLDKEGAGPLSIPNVLYAQLCI